MSAFLIAKVLSQCSDATSNCNGTNLYPTILSWKARSGCTSSMYPISCPGTCAPIGATCCGTGSYCLTGYVCNGLVCTLPAPPPPKGCQSFEYPQQCPDGSCVPFGAVCCGSGRYCQSGQVCAGAVCATTAPNSDSSSSPSSSPSSSDPSSWKNSFPFPAAIIIASILGPLILFTVFWFCCMKGYSHNQRAHVLAHASGTD